MSNKRKYRNAQKSLYLWHRYVGLFATLFIIFITLSGIALNHTDDLALKKQYVSNQFLLDSYNIQAPTQLLQFKTPSHTVTQADSFLFINTSDAITTDAKIIGVVHLDEFLVISLTNALLLIDSNNQVVETLSGLDGIPGSITGIGYDKNQHITLLANDQLYQLDSNLNVEQVPWNDNIYWSSKNVISPAASEAVIQQYKSNIISLETLFLDIHSGRFFGSYGTLFFDLIGVLVLFLALTGIIIWARQRTKPNTHD